MQKKLSIVMIILFISGLCAGYFLTSGDIGNKNIADIKVKSERVDIDPNILYKVENVIDGDTFTVMVPVGDKYKPNTVRMLGINTPEMVDPRKSPECFGFEASKETKSLLNNRKVKLLLNKNREKKDKYGRWLAYVYRDDGLFINQELINLGYAREYTVGRAYDFQSQFRLSESAAKETKAGLWGECP